MKSRLLIAAAALVAVPLVHAENLSLVCEDDYGRVVEQSFAMEDLSFTDSRGCKWQVRVSDSRIEQTQSCPKPHPNRPGESIKRVEKKTVSRTTGILSYFAYDDWGYTHKKDPDSYYELMCEKATKKF